MTKIHNENYSLNSALKIENEKIDLLNIGLLLKGLEFKEVLRDTH